MQCRILLHNLGAAWRQAKKRASMCPGSWTFSGWSYTIDSLLSAFGWQANGEWSWTHPALPTISLRRAHASWPDWPQLGHTVRESFRRHMYQQFVSSERRDAQIDAAYDEQVCARARKAAQGNKTHFQVLTGSTWSPAALADHSGLAFLFVLLVVITVMLHAFSSSVALPRV